MNSILLITGAPASGKSTIARAIAQRMEKSIHIRVDNLREMVVSGLYLPGPDSVWTAEVSQQFRLARTSAIQIALTYAQDNYTAILDDVCIPEHFAEDYAALSEYPRVTRILLKPSQEVILQRLAERNGAFDQILAQFIPWVYACMEMIPVNSWHVLDSSQWGVEGTVEQALAMIGQVQS